MHELARGINVAGPGSGVGGTLFGYGLSFRRTSGGRSGTAVDPVSDPGISRNSNKRIDLAASRANFPVRYSRMDVRFSLGAATFALIALTGCGRTVQGGTERSASTAPGGALEDVAARFQRSPQVVTAKVGQVLAIASPGSVMPDPRPTSSRPSSSIPTTRPDYSLVGAVCGGRTMLARRRLCGHQ
jgi:hypothetical protein